MIVASLKVWKYSLVISNCSSKIQYFIGISMKNWDPAISTYRSVLPLKEGISYPGKTKEV